MPGYTREDGRQRGGRQIWQANKHGLGFARVFNMINDIYGKEFIRYE